MERFKKPTPEELIDLAFATGTTKRSHINAMVSFAFIVIDRLYENGDAHIKTEKEKRHAQGESVRDLLDEEGNSKL